jgi:glycosyltransferase involved in cell wall biosynthesis
MKISHGARLAQYTTRNGYGYVTDRMLANLRKLGYQVYPNNPRADVNLWYDQPHHIEWQDNQYRVAYHPWESTELMEGWVDILNTADEVWTPSPIIADWYADAGVKPPIYVYEHGVDKIWSRQPRPVDGKIHFLHVGGEAKRKGGDIVLDAFRAAFPNRNDVALTMKMISKGMLALPTGRVTFVTESLAIRRLVRLYHSHHVFVYPSWGEGFGLNPLQAMRTGMPTIFTGAWAPYADLAPEEWKISSELVDSPWPTVHPGKMFKPDFDDLVEKMRDVADNYESHRSLAASVSGLVEQRYDWMNLTREAFNCLDNRVDKILQNS